MRSVFFLVLQICLFTSAMAQQTSFEGVVDYQLEIKSKNKLISDVSAGRMLGVGTVMKVHIKKGNFKRESSKLLEIQRTDSLKPFFMFKGIDTFYYHSPTPEVEDVPEIIQSDKVVPIAGYNCKSLTIRRKNITTTYYYDPALFQDPAYTNPAEKNDFTLFLHQTKSVYLKSVIETEQFLYTETAFRVTKTDVPETIFQMPAVPFAPFNFAAQLTYPFYKSGNEADWVTYVQKSINNNLVNKYVKIPKGEESASQTAEVLFVISANGTVGDAEVVNKKEIHPALANEALRIVKESYGWKPATIRGEKIDYLILQKITFGLTQN